MKRAALQVLLVTALLVGNGCSLWPLGRAEEPTSKLETLDVVDEQGPFDPSEAVDDEDEAGAALLDGDREPSDAPAFEPEHSTSAEVQQLIHEREQELRRSPARRDPEGAAKLQVARNPEPERRAVARPMEWQLLDYLLEGALIAACALIITTLLAVTLKLLRLLSHRTRRAAARHVAGGPRDQALIDEVQYLQAMIPHHSSAIMMSRLAQLKDPETVELSKQIIEARKREIAEMESHLERLRH